MPHKGIFCFSLGNLLFVFPYCLETSKSNEDRLNRERAHTEDKKRMASPDFLSGRGGADTFISMLSNPFSRKTSQQGPTVKSPKYREKDTEKETLEGAQKQV